MWAFPAMLQDTSLDWPINILLKPEQGDTGLEIRSLVHRVHEQRPDQRVHRKAAQTCSSSLSTTKTESVESATG